MSDKKVKKIMQGFEKWINKNKLCIYKCPCRKSGCDMYELIEHIVITAQKKLKKEE